MKNRVSVLTKTMIVLALAGSQSHAQSIYEPYTFTTLAGDAGYGNPSGVAVDSARNVYVADTGNHTIRKVTPDGVVTTLAGLAGSSGSAEGVGSDARFNLPHSVAVDSASNVFVADTGNHTIRKVTPVGVVTTFAGLAGSYGNADGPGSDARFGFPSGVAVDSAGNVYVADTDNMTIRKVSPSGVVTTLAGLAGESGSVDGTGSSARFYSPSGVAVDSAGNVYVADTDNMTIRKVSPSGVVTTLAGLAGENGSADGTGLAARFGGWGNGVGPEGPIGVAVDTAGNVYVADPRNHTIRKVTSEGVVTTLAGLAGSGGFADGTGSAARFGSGNPFLPAGPTGVAVDSTGYVYAADTPNNIIRKGYPAPRILNSGPGFGFNGGQFGFSLTGPAVKSVIVEASSDHVSWLPLWTNTFTFPAALNFSDPQSGAASTRFYRARLP